MSKPKLIRCLVDDTALTRNIAEIETWVSQGTVILIVPLYSMPGPGDPILHRANRKFVQRLGD